MEFRFTAKQVLHWLGTVLAAVTIAVLILVTLVSVEAQNAKRHNAHTICVAVNRLSNGMPTFISDLNTAFPNKQVTPQQRAATEAKVLDLARKDFPVLDCNHEITFQR